VQKNAICFSDNSLHRSLPTNPEAPHTRIVIATIVLKINTFIYVLQTGNV